MVRVGSCRGNALVIRIVRCTQGVQVGKSGSRGSDAMNEPRLKHGHVEWLFGEARSLFHDPRRFGAVLWHDAADGPIALHPLLSKLGVEPFDQQFTADWLRKGFRGRTQSVKAALLAGQEIG